MTPRTYLRIYDTTNTLKAILTAEGTDNGDNGFLYLAWRKRVNGVHTIQFEIARDNPDAVYMQDKYFVEVWRSDPAIGLAEYRALRAIIRDDEPYTDEDNRDRLIVRAYGGASLLARRRIAYPANTANLTTFAGVKAETVLKRLVQYNTDPAFATVANGRDRQPNALGLTIVADTLRGNTIHWNCGGRTNLLDEIQKVVAIAGGDFDVVPSGVNWSFDFYTPQLGTDRTSGANPIIFSIDRGNMINPHLVRNRSSVKTVAIVGGTGEESARVIRVVTGAGYSASNDIETYVDGRNSTTTAQLDAIGAQELASVAFRNQLSYDVLQSSLYAIDKDYFLGDIVQARYAGVTINQQVYEQSHEYKAQREDVTIVMRDL